MSYTPPPYEEYVKDWKIDKKNIRLKHICGFEGGWLPLSIRPSGVEPSIVVNHKRFAKFDKLLDQRGITEQADHKRALHDLLRQVEEIFLRDIKPLLRQRYHGALWEPVSNQSQPAVNTFHRINEGR